jgi:HD-GYP domain-containing protein (c-di-GMP phosphodiesterase class II)
MQETEYIVEDAGGGPVTPSVMTSIWYSPALSRLLKVNKELWVIFTIFLFTLIVNYFVSSQRLILNFYTLPTIISAYFFGRRHAIMTAVFTSLVIFLVVYSNQGLFTSGSITIFDRWFDLATWSGFLVLTAYAMGTLYESQKGYIRELRHTYYGILLILRQFISKDKYTQNHSYRVSVYATRIAAELGLDQERVEDVRDAALLYDIGKLDISREIICKAAGLGLEEFEVVKSHIEKRIKILTPVSGSLRRILSIVLAHHDKFDGSSHHPTDEEKIPLEARIIAVADVYDSLTSDRPYRKAMSPREAREIIVRGAGTDFDPGVVNIFQSVFEKGKMEVPEIIL